MGDYWVHSAGGIKRRFACVFCSRPFIAIHDLVEARSKSLSGLKRCAKQVKKYPQDPAAWFQLADALIKEGHLYAAQEAVQRGQRVAESVESWVESGTLLEKLGHRLGAITAFREATQRHRTFRGPVSVASVTAYTRLGSLLLEQGDPDAALLTLRVAVRLAPHDPNAHGQLAEALDRVGLSREAISVAQHAIRLRPDAPDGHRVLARVHARLGRNHASADALKTLTELTPEDSSVPVELGLSLAEAGRLDEARKLLDGFIGDYDHPPALLLKLGRALVMVGESAEAIETFRASVRRHPGIADLHFALGEALEAEGSLEEAVVEFEAAVSLDSSAKEPLRRLGLTLRALGRREESVRALIKASALDPDDTELRALLAWAIHPENEPSEDRTYDKSSMVATPIRSHRVRTDSFSSSSVRPEDGSFSGDLSVFSLPEILEFLLARRATGRLRVLSVEDGTGEIELLKGHIAWARTLGEPSLYARLHALGIDLSSQEKSPLAGDDARLAQWVIEQRLCSRAQLMTEMEKSIRAALLQMLGWGDGQVRFHTKSPPHSEVDMTLCLHPRAVLAQADRGV